jgi:hypothetical protein
MACVYQVKQMYNGHIGEYESWHVSNFQYLLRAAQAVSWVWYPASASDFESWSRNIHLASKVEQSTFTLLTNLSRMVALTVTQERT